jgi:hypothetical protein
VSPAWPGHSVDQRAAAYWARQITAALGANLIVQEVVAAWKNWQASSRGQQPDAATGSTYLTALAAYLTAHGVTALLIGRLTPIVSDIYAEGYAIGTKGATAAVHGAAGDWEGWEPGNAPQGATAPALTALQANAGTEARGMAETRTMALARLLAGAAVNGDNLGQVTALIQGQLGDDSAANQVSMTELTRAQSAAAAAHYQSAGVQTQIWVSANDDRVCPLCDENAKSDPVPVGMPFPTGDLRPPIHPGDRCALMPGPDHYDAG